MVTPSEPGGDFPPQSRRSRFGFPAVLAIIPFSALLAFAWFGIDFGHHWDERHNKIDAVAYSLNHDFTLLPDGYTYPGVNYWLTLGALAPEIARTAARAGADAPAFKAALLPVVNSGEFLLRLRRIYAFVTALTAAWIYLAVLVWGGSWLEAMACALLFSTSWEVVYHARWVAPDTILMQFGALTLLLLGTAWKRKSMLALRFAAVAAGFACGAKYPGGLLILPVLLTTFLVASREAGLRPVLLRCAGLSAIFAAAYLATTPGTLLQPIDFYQSLYYSFNVYAKGWGVHGYAVTPGLLHAWKMFVYFGTSVFSTFQPAALLFFGFALLGAWAAVDEDVRGAWVMLLFPVVYALYFSMQATMIVRNYLVLVPFAAVLAGRGLRWLHRRLPSGKARMAMVAVVSALVAIDAVDQMQACASIARRHDTARYLQDFVRYAEDRPGRALLVSRRLARDLQQSGHWPMANIVSVKAGPMPRFDEYVSYYSETVTPRRMVWQTNSPGTFLAVFGPREVNLDYYTGWDGDDRIISMSAPMSVETGVMRLQGK